MADAWVLKGSVRGPQGEPGEPGQQGTPGAAGVDGAPAGFGTPTASVDSTTGTPSVEVTATGPDTAKVFSFAFAGLKGETGAQGPQGPAGKDGAQGPQGERGPQGPPGQDGSDASVPNPLPVSQGGTGVTTADALTQLVFSHAPEASSTQAGVVKTLSDQDFCEYMGIEYNPEDWS